jgi:hypothetical protein
LRISVPRWLTTPTVPRLAASKPCPVQIWRTKEATDVLPLVPVTATAVLGWRPKKRAATKARSRRGSLFSMIGAEAVGRPPLSGARIATAPRCKASEMKRVPSVFTPGNAANR